MTTLTHQLIDTLAAVKTDASKALLNVNLLASYTKERLLTVREELLAFYATSNEVATDARYEADLWAVIMLLTNAIAKAPSVEEANVAA